MFEAPAKIYRNWISVQAFIRRNGAEILAFDAGKTYRLQDGRCVRVVCELQSNTWQMVRDSFRIVEVGA
jgi:hypothetical protein